VTFTPKGNFVVRVTTNALSAEALRKPGNMLRQRVVTALNAWLMQHVEQSARVEEKDVELEYWKAGKLLLAYKNDQYVFGK